MPETDAALIALAVLGRADMAALTAVLYLDYPPAPATAHSSDVGLLAGTPAVREQNGWWKLEPGAAAEILAALERDDLRRFRGLHERAVAHLAERLYAGELGLEPDFMAVLNRLASRLLQDDPKGFITLVESVRDVPLTEMTGRQLRRYFEGVALAKADRYAEALANLDALLGEPVLDDQVRGRALNSHAIYSYLTGRLQEALAGYGSSLELWRRLGNRLREGMALLNLGIIAYELQEYEQAESSLAQATRCFEDVGTAQQLASARNELGLVYRDQGRWAEALACFAEAAAQREEEGARDSLGRTQNNVGEVLLFQGRLAEAATAFREALANMQTRVFAVDAHLNLGLTHQAGGSLPAARAAFETALDVALTIGRRDILAQVHYRLGEALSRLGEAARALEHFRAAAEVIETAREPLSDEGLKISLLGRWQQVYEALVLHCLSRDLLAEAFAWAERARARAFADSLASRRPSSEASRDDDIRSQSLAVPEAIAEEVQASLPTGTTVLCYFTTGVMDRDIPMLRALPPHSLLREHLLTPARTLLFTVTRDRLTARECPLDPNAFISLSPRTEDRSRFLAPAVLHRLHTALWRPAAEGLEAKHLYVVPHGPLHHVPFGALTGDNGRPVIDADAPYLAYAPSATVLVRHCLAPNLPTPPGACLAVGYTGSLSAQALRHTESEAVLVSRLTNGEAWVGPAPKKERLREAAGDRRWLHLACHGWFNYEAPLESYLETGASERLTAREVLQDWRLQAEVVVLSACQTGASRILRGDEPMGLIRAFLQAGARAVLVSQWPVEDLPTFLLMQRFYGELQRAGSQHPDLAAALQAAQVWLRELTTAEAQIVLASLPAGDNPGEVSDRMGDSPSAARPFSYPHHWAAFALVGWAGG